MMRRRALLSGGLGLTVARVARASPGLEEKIGIELGVDSARGYLLAGRNVVRAALPADAFVSIGVLGGPGSLLGLEAIGGEQADVVRTRGPTDEDGLLPRFVSLATGPEASSLELVVDVLDPVEIVLDWTTAADELPPSPAGLKEGAELPRRLVCLPYPSSDDDGYALGVPARYVFLRTDLVRSLRAAFHKTRKKFKSDPISVSEASQWNGRRPRADLGAIRHISHDGGLDVDLALPASDTFPSSIRDHCRGVRLEVDRFGCAPGTAKGVDFERLAYLLGCLADEGKMTKVYLDDVYRREVIAKSRELFARKLMGDAGLLALGDDGLLTASPWHTDHVHVRFGGEKAGGPLK